MDSLEFLSILILVIFRFYLVYLVIREALRRPVIEPRKIEAFDRAFVEVRR